MAMTREQLHSMLDSVPNERLSDAQAALEPLTDPVLLAFLNAPEDDEETTEEDLQSIEAARAEYERGETVTLDEALANPLGIAGA